MSIQTDAKDEKYRVGRLKLDGKVATPKGIFL